MTTALPDFEVPNFRLSQEIDNYGLPSGKVMVYRGALRITTISRDEAWQAREWLTRHLGVSEDLSGVFARAIENLSHD